MSISETYGVFSLNVLLERNSFCGEFKFFYPLIKNQFKIFPTLKDSAREGLETKQFTIVQIAINSVKCIIFRHKISIISNLFKFSDLRPIT